MMKILHEKMPKQFDSYIMGQFRVRQRYGRKSGRLATTFLVIVDKRGRLRGFIAINVSATAVHPL